LANQWSDGESYEGFMGRWSRLVAPAFVRWLAVPPGAAWLDFGCGTGALTRAILDIAAPSLVRGCDRASAYVEHARTLVRDDRARFVVADLPNLPTHAGGFAAAVSGLVLNFLPDPASALRVLARHVTPGGRVAAYVWDYAADMQPLRVFWDQAVAMDPAATELDEGRCFPLCSADALGATFEAAGLRDVQVRPLAAQAAVRRFADYWTPFERGQGPAGAYLRTLPATQQAALRERVRAQLTLDPGGQLQLGVKAWAAQGLPSD
jgi:SAM-dependent methyltransferase